MNSENDLTKFISDPLESPDSTRQSTSTGTNLSPQAPDPRNRKTYYMQMTPLRRVLTSMLCFGFRFFTSIQASGTEKLPATGPVIVAANHLTNFDVFPMQFSLSRPIFFMGKEELFRNPVMDIALRHLGGFPVYRGARDEWAMQHAENLLRNGQVLGMFPEGKRSKGQGLRLAKTGVARLALAVGCPIVPLALHGPQYMFARFPHRTRVHIIVGEPIQPQPGETPVGLTDRIMFTLAEMLPPELRGVYRYRPSGF